MADENLFEGALKKITIEKVALPNSPLFDFYCDIVNSKRLIDAASSWADVMILHYGQGSAFLAPDSGQVSCIPFFHSNKFDWSLYGRLRPLAPAYTFPLRILESKCLNSIPLAFTNSRELRERIREFSNATSLVVVPLGVNLDRFHPTGRDDDFVMMAGRFHPTNNMELGIAAVRSTRYNLVIAGVPDRRYSRYQAHLQRTVRHVRELKDRVEFVSPDEEGLAEFLGRCSIFLSPRKYGYLGLASLEAMACGKPVIAYDLGHEIEGSPPCITCSEDSGQWGNAIDRLMADLSVRKELGRKSSDYVKERHTWKNSVEQMLHFICSTSVSKSEMSMQ
jgi:glycosyltransferase involved in cell wall biosynthesis